MASRAYVSWFNFKGRDQQRKVGALSGGERNRVHLAKLLRRGTNLLLLDEPTNDLDVDTLRALEEALLSFAGCAVVISHDRWFLDRIATHILAFEGDSKVVWFQGNYQDYEVDRKRRLGAEADQPHRIKLQEVDKITADAVAAERRRRGRSSSDERAGLAASTCCGAAGCADPNQPRFLSIATGGTGGVYYPYGGGLAKVLNEHLPGTRATAEVTGASVDNLRFVRDGQADLAFTMGDVLADAVRGRGPFEGKPVPIVALATLYTNYEHLVTLQRYRHRRYSGDPRSRRFAGLARERNGGQRRAGAARGWY